METKYISWLLAGVVLLLGVIVLVIVANRYLPTVAQDQAPIAGQPVTSPQTVSPAAMITPSLADTAVPTTVPTELPSATPPLSPADQPTTVITDPVEAFTPMPIASPTATIEASATPAASATPQPTAIPSSTPASTTQRGLPPDAIWILSGEKILAIAPMTPTFSVADQHEFGLISNVTASPDGSRIVYIQQISAGQPGTQLVAENLGTGQRQILDRETSLSIVSPQFSPDGSQLAYAAVSLEQWEIRVYDLPNGQVRVLRQGQGNLALHPITWNPQGLVVEEIRWATDAFPQNLALLNPDDGSLHTLRQKSHIRAVPSPDGKSIALMVGTLSFGEGPSVIGINILDTISGQERVLVPEQEMWVSTIVWSPNSARLLYTSTTNPQLPNDTLHILGADGSKEQALQLTSSAAQGGIRDSDWQDSNSVLALTAGTDGQIHLYSLPADDITASKLQELGTFAGDTTLGATNTILYVPR